MDNPFNVTFGELPSSLVSRENDMHIIESVFGQTTPESKVYIISGPRGSGKTVLLTSLINSFKDKGYLTIDLNPFEDLHEQFAAKLYEEGKMRKLFLHPEFSISFKGITFSIEGDSPVNNVSTLIDKMLEYLKSKGKRVLVTIDDISTTIYVKSFIFSYQQMIRNGYDVFLLVTGLYENVSALERDKSLTFFLRAPKLNLGPLNLFEITALYKNLLNLSNKDASKYAKMTKGYAYGYQLIGSFLFKNGNSSKLLDDYDFNLAKNSYSLSWERLSAKEKEILIGLTETNKQTELCNLLNMTNGNLQTYKKRLIEKGIIVSKRRGEIEFALPRFKEFVDMAKEFESDD